MRSEMILFYWFLLEVVSSNSEYLSNSHSTTENLADISGLKELEENYLLSIKITIHHQWCVMKLSNETNELEIKYM